MHGVDYDDSAGDVRARFDYYAIGLGGYAVPIRVTITNFGLIGYRCSGDQCNPAVTSVKCQTGCTFTSTSSNPVVGLNGVRHNAHTYDFKRATWVPKMGNTTSFTGH
jgi:hypothetical protein